MRVSCCYICQICLWLLLFLGGAELPAQSRTSLKHLEDSLDALIANEQYFIDKKEERINRIKLRLKNADMLAEYKINLELHDEYRKFNVDSAIHYIKRNIDIAVALGEYEQEIDSRLKLSLLYSMGGMYREAELMLGGIEADSLTPELLSDYYDTYRRFWEYYSISTTRFDQYRYQREKYMDLFLDNGAPTTVNYKVCYIMNRVAPQDPAEAERQLMELLSVEEEGSPDYAVITCELAALHARNGRHDLERQFYMQSAIADIRNVTFENYSLQRLAILCYESGELSTALRYTQTAINEALTSGIQFRATQINQFYSVINAAYHERETKSKSTLTILLILVTAFFFFVVGLLVYIYRQMKHIRQIKEELARSNEKLQELNRALSDVNEQLQSKNRQLQEANNVKEQFIAQFFYLCSNYITHMEEYQTSLYKLALNRRYEVLLKRLKSTSNIAEELDTLYNHFDNIFLNLYPTFVSDFNALLKSDEQVMLRSGQLLNKELRIYALLRLGINDGSKIAGFLRCSTSTIYNYRTRMRNKASINKEEFENEVLHIGRGKVEK